MVAMGWVLGKNKTDNTITIGDGNHETNVFEEKYTLSKDVKIYAVDKSSYDGSKEASGFPVQYNVSGLEFRKGLSDS